MKKCLLSLALALFAFSGINAQTVIFEDNFESYAVATDLFQQGYATFNEAEPQNVSFTVADDNGTNVGIGNVVTGWSVQKVLEDLEVGATYTWSFRFKCSVAKPHTISVKSINGEVETELSKVQITDLVAGVWRDYEVSVTIAEGDKLKFNVYRWFKDAQTSIDDYKIVKEISTAVGETSASKLEFYPNPSNGSFTLRTASEQSDLEVYSLNGKLVHSQKLDGSVNSVDLPDDLNGLYIMKVYSGSDVNIKKIHIVR